MGPLEVLYLFYEPGQVPIPRLTFFTFEQADSEMALRCLDIARGYEFPLVLVESAEQRWPHPHLSRYPLVAYLTIAFLSVVVPSIKTFWTYRHLLTIPVPEQFSHFL